MEIAHLIFKKSVSYKMAESKLPSIHVDSSSDTVYYRSIKLLIYSDRIGFLDVMKLALLMFFADMLIGLLFGSKRILAVATMMYLLLSKQLIALACF